MEKWVTLLVLATALAGCSDAPATTPAVQVPDAPSDSMDITGFVQDDTVTPIAGATVTILQLNLTQTTGADGSFRFSDIKFGFYVVRADAPEFATANLTVNPNANTALLFVLASTAETPYLLTVPFEGFITCAAEYLIITPSCDSVTEEVHNRGVTLPNNGSVVDDVAEFEVELEPGWETVVVDVAFDLSGHPGLEALRTTVAGSNDPNALTTYEQYGRFQDASSYTFQLEPGAEYPDGVAPVPEDSAVLRFNIYGQGHGWHATCDAMCLLGLGAATDVSFQLFVTAFYVDPAPAGWTVQV